MGQLSEHDQVQQFDRFGEWCELLLRQEWADSIPPEVGFKGWGPFERVAERIDDFERSVGNDRGHREAEYRRNLERRRARRLVSAITHS